MQVVRDLSNIYYDKKSAVTVGTFDGVHLGHKKIIEKLNSVKRLKSLRSIVITFDPHPQLVLKNRTQDIFVLNTLDEKLSIFEECSIDIAFVINFTKEFSATTAEEFYRNYLVEGTGLSELVLGYDHMFGKNREGNFDTLKKLSVKYDFNVDMIDEYKYENEHISSTSIRHLLQEKGDVKKASILLGKNYGIEGTVENGRKLGRELGFPTANIKPGQDSKLIPKNGVYAVKAIIENGSYFGMMSIGKNPTVTDDDTLKLEVNIFDFSGDIYGKKIRIEFLEYLRDECKFSSIDELKTQMNTDKENSLKIIYNSKTKINN